MSKEERGLDWSFNCNTPITLSGVTVTTPDKDNVVNATTWVKFLIQVPLERPQDIDTLKAAALAPTLTKGLFVPPEIVIEEPLYGTLLNAFIAHAHIKSGNITWEDAAKLTENVDLIGALLVRGYNANVNNRDRVITLNHTTALSGH